MAAFVYDAFLSYSRADHVLAADIERRLEKTRLPKAIRAKIGRRHLNVFRDQNDMTGSVLDAAIVEHLRRSECLVVLCSPRARESPWVAREIEAFAQSRDASRIIPVLVGGEPNTDRAADPSTWAFPDALVGALGGNPLATDLRAEGPPGGSKASAAQEWVRTIANIVAVSPDDLTQRIARERQRRLRLLLGTALLVAVALGGTAIWALAQRAEAQRQRDIARTQADLATSRQLAAAATDLPAADADLALALSLAARRAAATVQSADALLEALQRNPHLVRYLHGTTGFSGVVASSPDGSTAVGGSSDGQLVRWDLETGKADVLSDGGPSIEKVAYSPSGTTVIVVRRDLGDRNSVEAWDTATGTRSASRDFGAVELDDVAVPDDSTAVVAGGDEPVGEQEAPGLLARWRWSDDIVERLDAPRKVSRVVPVAGGLLVATGEFPYTRELVVVDPSTGVPRSEPVLLRDGSVDDLDASTDGRRAVATTGEEILVLDGARGNVVARAAPSPQAFAVRFVGDDSRIAVWQSNAVSGQVADHAIHVYDVRSLVEVGPTIPVPASVAGLSGVERQDAVLSAREDGSTMVWELGSDRGSSRTFGRELARVAFLPGDTAYTPDGRAAISVGPRASVVARSTSSGTELWRGDVLPDDQVARAVAVHPDGHVVAVAGGDIVGSESGTLALLDPRSGRVVETRHVAPQQVDRLAFSPDGRFLVAGYGAFLGLGGGGVVVLDLETGSSRRIVDVRTTDLTTVGDRHVWSRPDGVSWGSFAGLLRGDTPRTVAARAVGVLASTGDGRHVAVASGTRVGMLDLGDEAPAVTWFGEHRAPVESLTVNSAGTVLVSTDFRGEAVFWDARSGRPLTSPTLLGGGTGLFARFTPATGSELLLVGDGRISTIDGDPSTWARRACTVANRELTPTEWKRYVGADRPQTRLCPSS